MVIYPLYYNRILFMTTVKNALGLFLFNSVGLYSPKIALMFYSKIHSNKARNQKNQHWVSTVQSSATWDNPEAIIRKDIHDLALAANHCDLNQKSLLFDNTLQTQVHFSILRVSQCQLRLFQCKPHFSYHTASINTFMISLKHTTEGTPKHHARIYPQVVWQTHKPRNSITK